MSKEAMKLAAEFNKRFTSMNGVDVPERVSVPRDEWRALFAALAEQPAPVQEPFGYFKPTPFGWTDGAEGDDGAIALYAAKRTLVGLTEYEKSAALYDKDDIILDYEYYADAIEAKLMEKNA